MAPISCHAHSARAERTEGLTRNGKTPAKKFFMESLGSHFSCPQATGETATRNRQEARMKTRLPALGWNSIFQLKKM